ncbi:hypothetical protein A2U01_0092845, partial [Trifolium medium]|nr:hypothetical protein [Trifolium medium]
AWVGGATRSVGAGFGGFLLLDALRAGVTCAARIDALFRAESLLVPAQRAG